MMTPMREMPAPRMHAGMVPATFVAPGLVTAATVMMAASGDDGVNRIDDTARSCRALRPAARTVAAARAAAHAATYMATHAAVTAATAAAAGKCAIGGNDRDAQGAGKRQHPQHGAERP